MARCHEIEHALTNSFIFVAILNNQKNKSLTISDLKKSWKRKTFGQMMQLIEEGWDIEPTIKVALDGYKQMRNLLAHSLVIEERYDINTAWGCKELALFLSSFDLYSRLIKRVFQGSFYASIDLAASYLKTPKDIKNMVNEVLGEHEKELISLFFHAFIPKM
ncbi:MAG: hypothetical protein ACOYK8_00815 [Alphaproteobacteria bacterium]